MGYAIFMELKNVFFIEGGDVVKKYFSQLSI